MKKHERTMLKFAGRFHERLHAWEQPADASEFPVSSWERLARWNRQLAIARFRGWSLAEQRAQRLVSTQIEQLRRELAAFARNSMPPKPQIMGVRDIYGDIMALYDEFEEVALDGKDLGLSVTTPAIELEGVYLGPFKIVLEWDIPRSYRPFRYRVVALEPNPAASNEGVTHPHVQDESVCEGDGRHSIQLACEQGRILDLFNIVSHLLETYNADSPYIALSGWNGLPCQDCGTAMPPDDLWVCERCESRLCNDCGICCIDCSDTFCRSCMTTCEACGDLCCNCCLSACADCSNDFCRHCLNEQERCDHCHEQHIEEEETDDESTESEQLSPSEPPPNVTPVHAESVGQTAVST